MEAKWVKARYDNPTGIDYGDLTIGRIYDVRRRDAGYFYDVRRDDSGGTGRSIIPACWTFIAPDAIPFVDNVSSQPHYARFAIEPLEFITANNLPFWAGNIIKYVCRHDAKDGIRDLKKARDYLDKHIRHLEGDKDWCK